MGVLELLELLGPSIEDHDAESFDLFTSSIPSSNLGFVNSKAKELEITINGRDIAIQQSPSLLESNLPGGTTGAVLWKVTPLIAEWLSKANNPLFTTSSLSSTSMILELGAGISGLIPLALAPRVAQYIATDQTYILKTLQTNIASNTSTPSKQHKNPPPSNISILELDWELSDITNLTSLNPELRQTATHPGGLDVIIACDCIYNEALIRPFVDVCTELCMLRNRSDEYEWVGKECRPTICLIAQQLRSNVVFEEWLRCFLQRFQVWRVPDEMLSEELRIGKGYVVHIAVLQ